MTKNVVGLSVAPKVVDGLEQADKVSLRVYVQKKLAANVAECPIPSTIRFGTGETVQTDVVEVGTVVPHTSSAQRERKRPLVPGLSIGHPEITAGTLGCIVRRSTEPDGAFVLSNYHVLGDDGAAFPGDAVIQPGSADKGVVPGDIVATLEFTVPFHFDGTPCRVDAALARIEDGEKWQNDWRCFGNTIDVLCLTRLPQKSETVYKIGRTSGLTTGTVIDPNVEAFKIDHKEPGGDKLKPVVFVDQVLCSKYADGGDSGSIVFTSDGFMVGLHMAGSEEVSVFNKIMNVVQELHIEFIKSEIS
ncbi:hypothetical protein [Mesorhizobium sp. M1273]|uniref:hypothetical protein n=1 Tax=Mesorhizobium sp. M1273 TaxID=2957075 RepID=UPI00333E122F